MGLLRTLKYILGTDDDAPQNQQSRPSEQSAQPMQSAQSAGPVQRTQPTQRATQSHARATQARTHTAATSGQAQPYVAGIQRGQSQKPQGKPAKLHPQPLLPAEPSSSKTSSSGPSIPRDGSRTEARSESSSITMRSPQPSRCPRPVYRPSYSRGANTGRPHLQWIAN